jgi:hypothetical protein
MQGVTYALIGTLSVGAWTIRLREMWNMVKIDDLQRGTKKSDQSMAAILDERRS